MTEVPSRHRWIRRNLIILTPLLIAPVALFLLVFYGKWEMEHTHPYNGRWEAKFSGFVFSWKNIHGESHKGFGIKYDATFFFNSPHPVDDIDRTCVVILGVFPHFGFEMITR